MWGSALIYNICFSIQPTETLDDGVQSYNGCPPGEAGDDGGRYNHGDITSYDEQDYTGINCKGMLR